MSIGGVFCPSCLVVPLPRLDGEPSHHRTNYNNNYMWGQTHTQKIPLFTCWWMVPEGGEFYIIDSGGIVPLIFNLFYHLLTWIGLSSGPDFCFDVIACDKLKIDFKQEVPCQVTFFEWHPNKKKIGHVLYFEIGSPMVMSLRQVWLKF